MTEDSLHPYDAYLRAVNEPADDERLALLRSAVLDDFAIRSPAYEAKGHQEVNESLGKAMTGPDGARMSMLRATEIDEHHGVGRVFFDILDPHGAKVGAGQHVFERSGDRLAALVVFVGEPQPKG